MPSLAYKYQVGRIPYGERRGAIELGKKGTQRRGGEEKWESEAESIILS